jgi:hypothetical protein
MTTDQGALKLQAFEDRVLIRIKFACLFDKGPSLVSDAGSEYDQLFAELPDGWSVTETGSVEPIRYHAHPATRLTSRSEGDIVAVEYETGLELLLIAYALDKGTALVCWTWAEWRRRRGKLRRAGSVRGEEELRIETTHSGPDGTVTYHRTTIPAELVTDEAVQKLIQTSTPET